MSWPDEKVSPAAARMITPHLVVGIGGRERMIHFLDHEARLRILVARPIGDHFGNSAMLLVEDCFVFHR